MSAKRRIQSGTVPYVGHRYQAIHGHRIALTPTYYSWMSMKARCAYPKHPAYRHYGGRGITVCERWRTFENFIADVGERPAGKSLDRYPNRHGNYEPGNVRWATKYEQARNRDSVRLFEFRGQSMTVPEIAEAAGVRAHLLGYRLRKGWSIERAVSEPSHGKPRRAA